MDDDRSLADTDRHIEQTQQYIAQTQRFCRRIQAFAITLIDLSLLGLGYLMWLSVTQVQAHAAQTQALLELVRRLRP